MLTCRTKRLEPVQLDTDASVVADKHCEDMAVNGYSSTWNLRGEAPSSRYVSVAYMNACIINV